MEKGMRAADKDVDERSRRIEAANEDNRQK